MIMYASLASKTRQRAIDTRHDATVFYGASCFPSCNSELSERQPWKKQTGWEELGELLRLDSSKSAEHQQLGLYDHVWPFPWTNQSPDSASAGSRKTFSARNGFPTPSRLLWSEGLGALGVVQGFWEWLGDRRGSIMLNLSNKYPLLFWFMFFRQAAGMNNAIRSDGMGLVLLNP